MPSICELCNPSRYADTEWMRLHREIADYSVDTHVFFHLNGGHVYRKGWEWTQCVYGLEQLGLLQPSVSALGVGAGREPLIFYLTDYIAHVTALDLYGNAEWSRSDGVEASIDVTEHPEQWCPRPFERDRAGFVIADGTHLDFPDQSFDFCWSLSSIEHFGGHPAAAAAMREMARVTKPGGIVALATEYLLLPEHRHADYFNHEDLDRYIIGASGELRLVSDIDFSTVPAEYLTDSIVVPGGVDRRRRHVVLNDGNVQWTSIMLFFRKV